MDLRDVFDRSLRNLRVSVTDRCNLRCTYCMPEDEYAWLPRADLLTFEETAALVGAFASLGVDRVRLTGGEPLLRRDLPALVALLARDTRLRDLALTTNGVLLEEQAGALRTAGLHRVTVSLDTLDRARFAALTRQDALDRVLAGIRSAAAAGFAPLKLDCVVVRGTNDDEIAGLVDFARGQGAEIRFIEYMDVGGATRWSPDLVVDRAAILKSVERRHGRVEPVVEDSNAPAERFRLADGTTFGVIASVTAPFCARCDRSRLTADGLWYTCLYAVHGTDLRGPLRAGEGTEAIAARIRAVWEKRRDRGAEDRLAARGRGAFVGVQGLRADPHLEMHTRGG